MSSYQPGHDISTKERTVDVLTTENVSFKDLLLSSQVLCGLRKSRFDRPSPIQLKAIPYGRCGLDLIVQAKSGTGKTCVFSVIALEAISVEALTLQVLILAPTREIAIQIEDVIKAIGQDIKGLNIAAFIGGRPVSEDKVNAKGCHIAVGSPGRIFQLIELEILKCQNIRILVLDEADKLLEDNFQSQINSIYSMLPANKQMIAASATYPKELANFVTLYMRDPTFVRLNPQDMALLGVKQYYYQIEDPPDKFVSVFECKIKAVVELLDLYTFQQALIFSNYHSHAKDLSDACNSVGLPATYISGNLEQERRLEAMKMLKDFKCRVLISTDLTSRGIDASNVDLVLNLDVPMDWETYMHRTGRAGRFGTRGAVISVVTSGKERDDLFKIAETCAVQLYSLTFQSGKVVLGSLPVDFSELSTDQSNQGCHEMKATKMRSTTKKNVPFLNPASKVEPPTETLNSFEDENLPQGSSQIEPRCHELKGTKMRSTTKKNVPFQNLASKAEPFETLNSYEDRNLPQSSLPNEQILQIPSLPELMSKTCDAAKFSFSFSYHDLMENYLHFKEHGVFKELKRIDRIDSPEKRGFDQADCEQDSKKLLSKIMLQEYQDASKDPTEKVPETTGNGSLNKVNGRSTNIRNKITEEDYRSRHVQGEGLENPVSDQNAFLHLEPHHSGMDREWHQEAVRGCHKQGSEEELKQHSDVSLFKTGDQDLCKKKHEKEKELFNKTEPSQSTTEETARSRPKNKKNKKTRSTNDFVDSHFSTHPNFLLPRYSPRFENEGFEDFTRMPDHVHVLRQYQQAWDNHWYWWTQWYNMSNFRR